MTMIVLMIQGRSKTPSPGRFGRYVVYFIQGAGRSRDLAMGLDYFITLSMYADSDIDLGLGTFLISGDLRETGLVSP